MNKRTFARLDMNSALLSLLQDFPAIVQSVPAFAAVHAALEANVNEMNAALQVLLQNNKGITLAKRNTRLTLAVQTALLSGVLGACAVQHNLPELRGKVKTAPSLFKVMGGNRLLAMARMIRDELTDHLPLLAGYNITAETISRYDALISEFDTKIVTPRLALNHRKATTQLLKNLVRRNRELIEWQLKPLAQLFRESEHRFWQLLTDTLRIRDAYTRHTRIEGTVADAATGEALAGAEVMIEGTPWSATTDENGVYKLYITGKGRYTLLIHKPGYDPLHLPGIPVFIGHTTEQNAAIQMTEDG